MSSDTYASGRKVLVEVEVERVSDRAELDADRVLGLLVAGPTAAGSQRVGTPRVGRRRN